MEMKNMNGMNKDVQHMSQPIPVTHPSKLQGYIRSLRSVLNFIYNRDERTFIGRDGKSWAKISVCYLLFYSLLGGAFVAFLAIFAATLDRTEPRYYLEHSVMATRNKINPGLGFRPQLDTEDQVIAYSTNPELKDFYENFLKLNKSITNFLHYKYELSNGENEIVNCDFKNLDEQRLKFKNEKAYCKYNYSEVLESTTCSPSLNFGYAQGPCVIIKLNRLYNWLPEPYTDLNELPKAINSTIRSLNNAQDLIAKNIFLKCEGEFSADIDSLENVNISYYSADEIITEIGVIPIYYYPYLNQPGYKSPLVFVHFQNLPKHALINVLCKAYANNIDSTDKLNLRGMSRFQVYHGY